MVADDVKVRVGATVVVGAGATLPLSSHAPSPAIVIHNAIPIRLRRPANDTGRDERDNTGPHTSAAIAARSDEMRVFSEGLCSNINGKFTLALVKHDY